ncbi:hypothetical protein ADUPG1_013538, partial [Aduncisulcus paluster]
KKKTKKELEEEKQREEEEAQWAEKYKQLQELTRAREERIATKRVAVKQKWQRIETDFKKEQLRIEFEGENLSQLWEGEESSVFRLSNSSLTIHPFTHRPLSLHPLMDAEGIEHAELVLIPSLAPNINTYPTIPAVMNQTRKIMHSSLPPIVCKKDRVKEATVKLSRFSVSTTTTKKLSAINIDRRDGKEEVGQDLFPEHQEIMKHPYASMNNTRTLQSLMKNTIIPLAVQCISPHVYPNPPSGINMIYSLPSGSISGQNELDFRNTTKNPIYIRIRCEHNVYKLNVNVNRLSGRLETIKFHKTEDGDVVSSLFVVDRGMNVHVNANVSKVLMHSLNDLRDPLKLSQALLNNKKNENHSPDVDEIDGASPDLVTASHPDISKNRIGTKPLPVVFYDIEDDIYMSHLYVDFFPIPSGHQSLKLSEEDQERFSRPTHTDTMSLTLRVKRSCLEKRFRWAHFYDTRVPPSLKPSLSSTLTSKSLVSFTQTPRTLRFVLTNLGAASKVRILHVPHKLRNRLLLDTNTFVGKAHLRSSLQSYSKTRIERDNVFVYVHTPFRSEGKMIGAGGRLAVSGVAHGVMHEGTVSPSSSLSHSDGEKVTKLDQEVAPETQETDDQTTTNPIQKQENAGKSISMVSKGCAGPLLIGRRSKREEEAKRKKRAEVKRAQEELEAQKQKQEEEKKKGSKKKDGSLSSKSIEKSADDSGESEESEEEEGRYIDEDDKKDEALGIVRNVVDDPTVFVFSKSSFDIPAKTVRGKGTAVLSVKFRPKIQCLYHSSYVFALEDGRNGWIDCVGRGTNNEEDAL